MPIWEEIFVIGGFALMIWLNCKLLENYEEDTTKENSVIEKEQIQNVIFLFQKYKLLIIFSCIAFILIIINLVLLRRKLSP